MGVRGELFSTKVALQNRTYFFNVKENRLGDLYLNIVESKNRDEGGFERQSVILFADDLAEFLQGFDESLRVLEKAAREKRRGSPKEAGESRIREPHFQGAGGKRGRTEEKDYAYKSDAAPRQGRGPSRVQGKAGFHDRPRSSERPQQKGPKVYRQGRPEGRPEGGHGPFKTRRDAKSRDQGDSKNYRSNEKGGFAPRKKRVVVKKR